MVYAHLLGLLMPVPELDPPLVDSAPSSTAPTPPPLLLSATTPGENLPRVP